MTITNDLTTAGGTTATVRTDQTHASTLRTAMASVAARARPLVAQRDLDGSLPADVLDLAREQGITAALVPPEFGGGGISHAEMGQLIRILGRSDPSAAVTLSMHSHLVAFQVWRHLHGQDASALFGKVVDGAWLVSTGAADWVSSSGTARKVDGGYVVSGRKAPASGCEVGTILVTSIRWEQDGADPQVIHCAVPFSAEGVSVEQTWDTTGLRATGSHTVVLEDVFVPDAAVSLVRPADVWHPVWNIVMGAAMPLIMAAYAGIADALVDAALDAAAGRHDDHVFHMVGELLNAHLRGTDAVDAMFREADDLRFDNTDVLASRILSRKTAAAESFVETGRLAVELVGGRAFSRGNDVERLNRDVQGAVFHPLPKARQARFTGRVALGLSPVP
jgi:alkylation response protein AidB-like acyl-CoA dehydrogenase